MDIVGERLQQRDIEHLGLVGQRGKLQPFAHQRIDDRLKGGQGLALTGGHRNQRIAYGLDRRPGPRLDLGRRTEMAGDPDRDGRVKPVFWHAYIIAPFPLTRPISAQTPWRS